MKWVCRLTAANMSQETIGSHSQWRHNGHNAVSNHQPHDCLLNRLFRRILKKTSKLRVTGLSAGNSQVNSPHKWPVKRKMFPFDYVIMIRKCCHFEEIFIADCTGSSQNNNFQGNQPVTTIWSKWHFCLSAFIHKQNKTKRNVEYILSFILCQHG